MGTPWPRRNMDGITDSVVRNNLLYNNRASGIAVF
jgi:hypothetical protein